MKASCGRRGHRADSRRSWVRRRQVRHTDTRTHSDALGGTADGFSHKIGVGSKYIFFVITFQMY